MLAVVNLGTHEHSEAGRATDADNLSEHPDGIHGVFGDFEQSAQVVLAPIDLLSRIHAEWIEGIEDVSTLTHQLTQQPTPTTIIEPYPSGIRGAKQTAELIALLPRPNGLVFRINGAVVVRVVNEGDPEIARKLVKQSREYEAASQAPPVFNTHSDLRVLEIRGWWSADL